jgi:hypothetical protein
VPPWRRHESCEARDEGERVKLDGAGAVGPPLLEGQQVLLHHLVEGGLLRLPAGWA